MESVSLLIYKHEIDSTMFCLCIAYSKNNNQQTYSNKAAIRKSCMSQIIQLTCFHFFVETELYFSQNYKDLGTEFMTEPMDEIAYEGDTIELRCDPPKGEPRSSVYWLKDNVKINTKSDSSRLKLSNDYSLLILVSQKQDTGEYTCAATNGIEFRLSSPAKLMILGMYFYYFLRKNYYIKTLQD